MEIVIVIFLTPHPSMQQPFDRLVSIVVAAVA
jgi:hypothetical protein